MAKQKYFLVAENAEIWGFRRLNQEEIDDAVDTLIREDLYCEEDTVHVCKVVKSYKVTRKLNIERKEI